MTLCVSISLPLPAGSHPPLLANALVTPHRSAHQSVIYIISLPCALLATAIRARLLTTPAVVRHSSSNLAVAQTLPRPGFPFSRAKRTILLYHCHSYKLNGDRRLPRCYQALNRVCAIFLRLPGSTSS
jgi:hypothetical protein